MSNDSDTCWWFCCGSMGGMAPVGLTSDVSIVTGPNGDILGVR